MANRNNTPGQVGSRSDWRSIIVMGAAWMALLTFGRFWPPALQQNWSALLLTSLAAGLVAVVIVLRISKSAARPPISDEDPAPSIPLAHPAASHPISGTTESIAPLTHTSLTLSIGSMSMAKLGNDPNQNEDSCGAKVESGLFVVCDGASSSYDSKRWAEHLCSRYLALAPTLDDISLRQWAVTAVEEFQKPESGEKGTSQWWGAAVDNRPSHATFTALRLTPSASGVAWSAAAVGDSCLVHLRPDGQTFRLVDAFPIERSGGFGGDPWLLASNVQRTHDLPPIRFTGGTAVVGDTFLLMTDEMSRWTLSLHESAQAIWPLLLTPDQEPLLDLISRHRADGTMINDDMTFVGVTIMS